MKDEGQTVKDNALGRNVHGRVGIFHLSSLILHLSSFILTGRWSCGGC